MNGKASLAEVPQSGTKAGLNHGFGEVLSLFFRKPRDLSRGGFTLTEAVLTIVIMGILAMVILPHFVNEGFVGGLTLRTATSGITADIRYTRQLALTNSGHYLIKFDFNQREYNIYKDDILPGNQVGEVKKISSDIALSGTDQFDFYPMGNCLFSGQGLSLSLSANQYRIIVEPPSGAVVIEKIS